MRSIRASFDLCLHPTLSKPLDNIANVQDIPEAVQFCPGLSRGFLTNNLEFKAMAKPENLFAKYNVKEG